VYSPPNKECPLAPPATQVAHTIRVVQTRIPKYVVLYDGQGYQWNLLAHNKEFMEYANAHVGPESSLRPQDTNRCRNPPPLPY
jgi:hypothetical protein